jgi:purine-binding chemotaxis protein CheW
MTSGFILFRLDEHTFATPLDVVREIVRLASVERLPGTTPPLAGVTVLRGRPLPVWDVRTTPSAVNGAGDCLVVDLDGETVGIAVDAVLAVLQPHELDDGVPPGRTLPPYVTGVSRRGPDPVLLVDLKRLLDAA